MLPNLVGSAFEEGVRGIISVMSILRSTFAVVSLAVLSLTALFVVATTVSASLYGRGVYNACQYGNTCALTISTSGAVALSVDPTSGGTYTIANDEVTVTTNSTLGYTLSLEMNSAVENSLVAAEGAVPTSSSTVASPSVLSGNQWGFRIDGQAGFGMGPTAASTNQSSSTLTFAGVPLLDNPVTVKSTSTDAPTGDVTNVWYGIRADTSQPAGSYTGTVLYTAVTL